jgi:hypothetical protein
MCWVNTVARKFLLLTNVHKKELSFQQASQAANKISAMRYARLYSRAKEKLVNLNEPG